MGKDIAINLRVDMMVGFLNHLKTRPQTHLSAENIFHTLNFKL